MKKTPNPQHATPFGGYRYSYFSEPSPEVEKLVAPLRNGGLPEPVKSSGWSKGVMTVAAVGITLSLLLLAVSRPKIMSV